jgi:hypothetical protein
MENDIDKTETTKESEETNTALQSLRYPAWLLEFIRSYGDDSLGLLHSGFEDYVASRACWQANCPNQWKVLAQQSVEKILKAGLRLSGNTTPFKQWGHKLLKISEAVSEYDWFQFDQYNDLLAFLETEFVKRRYPPTSEDPHYLEAGGGAFSIDDLALHDHFMIDFMDSVPLREELKYTNGVYAAYLNLLERQEMGVPDYKWNALAWENQVLAVACKTIPPRLLQFKDYVRHAAIIGLSIRDRKSLIDRLVMITEEIAEPNSGGDVETTHTPQS